MALVIPGVGYTAPLLNPDGTLYESQPLPDYAAPVPTVDADGDDGEHTQRISLTSTTPLGGGGFAPEGDLPWTAILLACGAVLLLLVWRSR